MQQHTDYSYIRKKLLLLPSTVAIRPRSDSITSPDLIYMSRSSYRDLPTSHLVWLDMNPKLLVLQLPKMGGGQLWAFIDTRNLLRRN